ncbi:unnamed protein product [Prunus armeniaca]|uniref:Uncharacterized protein n=1 Tax=Prunus armeniaca TaxID=36596 RepID=A0A6J5W8G9_PRUAR|nr:unnamed protein product [Prunus armeniaca]
MNAFVDSVVVGILKLYWRSWPFLTLNHHPTITAAIVVATTVARATTFGQGQSAAAPSEGSFFIATGNHCLKIATGQLHGPHHSTILMELRETIQSDAAMDHIMPCHECLRQLRHSRYPQTLLEELAGRVSCMELLRFP